MRNNTARGDQGQMTTPVREPIRTVTTTGHQSLLTAEQLTIDLNDVLFRMLEPREIAAAMDFPGDYRILGNRREQVRQAGNAVTPPRRVIWWASSLNHWGSHRDRPVVVARLRAPGCETPVTGWGDACGGCRAAFARTCTRPCTGSA
ncbi:C-5 cytosine-specific DNA methylase family protein [Mycobacterium xenopi 3993]|nr:C-5 cytosine-specific DNA methylase family protein [Mycobacterium xenopi 3993]